MTTATAKPKTIKQKKEEERQEAIGRLRAILKSGDTVYTILRHRARSGMFRVISLVAIVTDETTGEPEVFNLDSSVCTILDRSWNNRHEGIPVGGSGMDMGYHLVYSLSRALFPDGFGETSENGFTPKTKEEAKRMVAKKEKFHGRNGDPSGWDNDGGYALKHRWL